MAFNWLIHRHQERTAEGEIPKMQRFVGDRGHVMLQVTVGSFAEASGVERALDVLEIQGGSQHHAGNEGFPFTTFFKNIEFTSFTFPVSVPFINFMNLTCVQNKLI